MSKREKIQTVPLRNARINIRASNDLLEALVEMAAEDNRSLSGYVERVLAAHVAAHRAGSSRSGKKTSR
jgi:predicted HicB family RNase H-like nuclease